MIFSIRKMEIVTGNLLDYPIIAHQCNCSTCHGKGLYTDIAEKYPFADIYSQNIARIPGDIIVSSGECIVIAMLAQVHPGKARNYGDKAADRLKYFKSCLDAMAKLPFEEIAFPFGIGCGLAGGKWADYEKLLREFAKVKRVIIVSLAT
jgi:O-acetyl-ADP-ribose deacetylase (regulator of RNase III)